MGRKNKQLPLLESVEITDVAAEGMAIAKTEDGVVFVPFVAPGDVVDIQVTKKKHSYMEGRAVRFEKYSDERTEPFCEHFGTCGGCKWQHLPYDKQLFYKQKQIIDNLTRIGKVELQGVQPILGSVKTQLYRNKLEFSFSNKRWMTREEMDAFKAKTEEGASVPQAELNGLGFHIPKLFDKILDIRKCWLQDDIQNRIRLDIKKFATDNDIPFFDLRAQTGFMRGIIIRTSSTGELMVIVIFYENNKELIDKVMNHLRETFAEITSLVYIVNSKVNDSITDQEVILFSGRDHIFEEMEGLKFKIGPKSFYQTNSLQAYELYKVARNFAGLTGDELVYDLYTGTGTIANFVARQCREVIGIEYVPEAIEDAKINASLNGLNNTQFYAGDMKDILTQDFINKHGRPDVIITDPPRAGMHDDVINTILFAAPKRIVYVSCNPATQARDLSLLDGEYAVKAVQPVDMFPHTQHVENVVLLERRTK
ncbi:MAG: 23S rRNA (uracil(1939)-C(5))-methyltransferase RlmD [Paludibacteraceae bacterium]|nr:23S rRNA (uracil(1939)-C(5))-methyltransferase RlmD [Paludibacteraceae bacterium]